MSRDLGEALRARKFPVRVSYGPERLQREGYDLGIVVERDRERGDAVTSPRGQQLNPRLVAVRTLGAKATIYARSSLAGARIEDHESLCDQIVDGFLVALREWLVATRAGDLDVTESRYLAEDERNDVETWPGVVYVIHFNVPRGVRKLDFAGLGRPTGSAAGISNRTEVRLAGDADSPPAIGCGAPVESEDP